MVMVNTLSITPDETRDSELVAELADLCIGWLVKAEAFRRGGMHDASRLALEFAEHEATKAFRIASPLVLSSRCVN